MNKFSTRRRKEIPPSSHQDRFFTLAMWYLLITHAREQRLNLADTGITDAGVPCLSPLTRLRDLSLFFCSVNDSSLSSLRILTRLKQLNLDTRCYYSYWVRVACLRGRKRSRFSLINFGLHFSHLSFVAFSVSQTC